MLSHKYSQNKEKVPISYNNLSEEIQNNFLKETTNQHSKNSE